MKRRVPAGAGALGGVAAGLALLCASTALVAGPAARPLRLADDGQSASQSGGLRIIGGEGTLTAVGDASLTPVESVRIVQLAPGYVAWNPGGGDPLTCLAQAVYFEARSESEAGQRAVAQVVINRSHMPQYPATVCGVVYQGSERATGCQFTFVCDGSLREPGDANAWSRAIDIARQALAGFVYKPMLGATHYHAAWMTPYWSGSLTRIRQIGGQVFYH